jgi:TadE-like protein
MTHKATWKRLDRGSAQVEFAFSALFMLVAVLTLMELCNAVYTFVVLSDAANEGVRYAVVRSSDANLSSDVATRVGTYASAARLSDPSNPNDNFINHDVTVSCPDGSCAVPNRVRVQISYPYADLFGIFGALQVTNPTMQAYAEGRMIY